MGLARKGSRKIQVAGDVYRWAVSADDGFMTIVVERDAETGPRMEAQVKYRDRASGGQFAEITPAVVRRAIEHALRDG